MSHRLNIFASVVGVSLVAGAATVSLTGCSKNFLNRQPLGQYTNQNYPYPSGGGPYDQYVFAAYASLRNDGNGNVAVSDFNYLGATSIRADDDDKGSTATDSPDQIAMDGFPVTPTNGLINDLWNGYYASISKCNTVLQVVGQDSSGTAQSVKTLAQAEARFIRAYDYFMLVRLWGSVPLIDTLSSNISQSNVAQSTSTQIYAFIESDLQFAAANLPASWPSKYIGRVTTGSANGMLSKVYLYEQKWQLAMTTAQLVINSGVYNLNTPYNVIFTEAGENSSEAVFEIQAYADASNPENLAYGCGYANRQGVRGAGVFNLGWGFNVPAPGLVTAYETGDPRADATLLYCPSTAPTQYGEVFPVEPNPIYNMKEYTNPQIRAEVGDMFGWWMDIRVQRYADVVLIDAEAANELGQTTEALAKLEMVRARARAGNSAILPMVTTTDQTQLRLAIQHERRIEFAMEAERFFDCVRWGINQAAESAAGKSAYLDARDKLLPIPQTQLDLSKGVLKQNPLY
ncbi:MAG TPA: RagB/SusD family nutrient uptake outer membrane protein [Dinghuibacter sp.]|jgi:hypothetical protein|uniref:RagB/SusD family nutrient uptake outer membrane protein n=1 Tax=Dinghuibacter sp. TaxID=2024697 RepID=UPI002CAECFE0|nr:RagB/SusD family nutrient uptake outer membrane protein [Dinghuibacter sp.]HTJ10714.1 RagB/SusD family nutrient uptake outer membrane protein [Dinghuibacter sp.]